MYSIMIVDDEPEIIETIESFLEIFLELDFTVKTFSEFEAAKNAISNEKFDLVISDYLMPGGNGGELYELNLQNHASEFVLLTGSSSPKSEPFSKYLSQSKFHYIQKPFEPEYFTEKITSLLRSSNQAA